MLAGRFEEAWRVSDRELRSAARQDAHAPRHQQRIWGGEPLNDRRVLVRCYHGLGDTIQFVRYASLLERVGAHVILWVQPALQQLLTGAAGVREIAPLHDGDPGIVRDADIEIMELPHAFRTTLATVPRDVPYLPVHATPNPVRRELAIGLVWHAGEWDARRSVPATLLAPLARVPGVTIHSLQLGPARTRLPAWIATDASDPDVVGAAHAMRALDLIISVDSMPAHLAGALGVPVWTLLHADADWRWMRHRADSPWYPTMRLFRQARAGDWTGVVAALTRALQARAAAHAHAA